MKLIGTLSTNKALAQSFYDKLTKFDSWLEFSCFSGESQLCNFSPLIGAFIYLSSILSSSCVYEIE